MIKGFRDFVMRGNVVDLAVGIVIGAAFGALINQFVKSFIEPLIKLVTGGQAASGQWRVNDAVVFDWGGFINQVIVFVLTAAAVYFFVVLPLNQLNQRRGRGRPEPEEVSNEERLLTEIRDSLRSGR
jgi:large conductance mechanosensitive channel